ncbi:MAG: DUF1800 domain-containing protein [Candidatus Koribacter versatilis]|uniref:DUF1800 domain-containing protein n=1 Tax=Candidatus Korobacter versatilis TaxID=658062 RepID=A0A932A9J9_9BACT|nr:DUF1800 domain-containing protein [Candidatus Koribacter versatilis]
MKVRRVLGPLALVLAVSAGMLLAADKTKTAKQTEQSPPSAAAPAAMDDSKRALHALNRLTFGPRPGDVQRVQAMGVDKWIELQLHPEKLDDGALQARLSSYRTLAMDSRELLQNFPPPFVLKAVEAGRMPMPSDSNQRAVYESQMAAYRARKENKAAKGNDGAANNDDAKPAPQDPNAAGSTMTDEQRAERREARRYARTQAEEITALPPDKRIAELLKLTPEQRTMLARGLPQEDRERLLAGMTPQQRETVLAMANPRIVVAGEMQSAKILRAAYSERQLEEVMTDFWFNHFNVYDKKGPDAYMIGQYERDAIRPHVLGKFEDLLLATARSPAMLFYLDNWQSVGPDSAFAKNGGGYGQQGQGQNRRFRRGGFGQQQPRMQRNDPNQQGAQQIKQRRSGLNENYAREVMELHTLGVDGGYTQQDVTELAKVLTGWTMRQPRLGGGYEFNARMHEPGSKIVLGHQFSGGGESEAEAALKMLAHQPATAKFVSRKLAMRFVADEPPAALVDRMAQTFLKKDGDIREVLRTMFHSPEFWSRDAYRAKVKTPFEFVVSSLRATGAEIQNPFVIAQALNKMGMPLYGMQPPTGYSMKADAWVNSAALLNRMNFALGLGTGRLPGVNMDSARALGAPARDPQATLAMLEQKLLDGDVSKQTHQTLQKQLADPKVAETAMGADVTPEASAAMNTNRNPGVIAGLILGSPEFQRR